jgi:hypothetical protein
LLLILSTIFIQSLTITPLFHKVKKQNKHTKKSTEEKSSAMKIAFNLLIISTIYFVSALSGLTGFNAGVVVCIYLFINFLITIKSENSLRFIFKDAKKHMIHVFIAILQIMPAIVKLSQTNVILGAATTGNNDISSYALVSKVFLINGFEVSNVIAGVDLNSFAEKSAYQTPNFLISFLAIFFGNSTLRIMVLVQVIALTFVSMCFYEFVKYLAPKANKNLLRVMSGFVMYFPLNNYIVANYFLAHILSLGVTALMFLKLFELNDAKSFRNVSEASIALGLSIYVYPPVAIPMFLIFSFIILLTRYSSLKKSIEFMKTLIYVLAFGCFLTTPYLLTSIDLLRAQSEVVAGWPIPPMSPMAILIWPQLIGWILPFSSVVVLWCISILTIFLIARKLSGLDAQRLLIVSFATLGLVFMLYLEISDRDMSDYQSWKLLSFFICFTILIVISVASSAKAFGSPALYVMIGLLFANPMIEWWPALNARNNVTNATSFNLKNDAQIKGLQEINIDVSPYFKTMNVASELIDPNRTIYLNSQSYYKSSSNPEACTIVENSDVRAEKGRKLNTDFSLISSEDKSCDPFS